MISMDQERGATRVSRVQSKDAAWLYRLSYVTKSFIFISYDVIDLPSLCSVWLRYGAFALTSAKN